MQLKEEAPAGIPRGAINLASATLGAEAVFANDEFFAPRHRMIQDSAPIFIPDKYDDHGKWMDGWETRRRRDGGTHDYCIVKLGAKGLITAVDIDTRHFTGNFPPQASVEAARCDGPPDENTVWIEIVPRVDIDPDYHNLHAVHSGDIFNYIRLNIFPDGGVARLRVYGFPVADWDENDTETRHELSSAVYGGRVLGYSDAHYGDPWVILAPKRGVNMGDGWETRRRRGPGHDWIVIALGAPGIVDRVAVDTAHFKGNYPARCSVQAAYCVGMEDADIIAAAESWDEMLAPQKLEMDRMHLFEGGMIECPSPVSHVRLNIYPDGGVSRFRVFGHMAGGK
jgi:allantoicase